MNSIASPNWLAIAGLIHLAFALGLIVMALTRHGAGSVLQRTRAEAARRVDALMAMPFLAVGFAALVGAQLVTAAVTPSIVVLILSAPLALLLYMGYEGLWTDGMLDQSMLAEPAKPLLRLPSPAPAPTITQAQPVIVPEPQGAHPNGSAA
jgi:hypothetical protein